MQPDEVLALGELAGDALVGVTGYVREVHEGIAARVWQSLGPPAMPVRLVHDAVTAGVYAGVQRSLGLAAHSVSMTLSITAAADAPSLQRRTGARVALGVLNGAIGDTLERRGNALALKMAVRHRDADVELTRTELGQAFPHATPRVAIFVHGLCETDDAWRIGADRHVPYGERLQADLGYTPLYLRYNTGRPVADNGRQLAALLERLSSQWPVQLNEIALIGHGMGGLVCDSACHQADGEAWARSLRHVITLGSPHRGAPLERTARLATGALGRMHETRGLARALNRRSAGIKELRAARRRFPTSAQQYVIDYRRLGSLYHFELLNHPAVYEQMRRRLGPRALPAAPGPQRP